MRAPAPHTHRQRLDAPARAAPLAARVQQQRAHSQASHSRSPRVASPTAPRAASPRAAAGDRHTRESAQRACAMEASADGEQRKTFVLEKARRGSACARSAHAPPGTHALRGAHVPRQCVTWRACARRSMSCALRRMATSPCFSRCAQAPPRSSVRGVLVAMACAARCMRWRARAARARRALRGGSMRPRVVPRARCGACARAARIPPRCAHASVLTRSRCHVTGCEVAVGQRTALCAQKVALFTWHGATVELEGAPDIACVTPVHALRP
jgi:hypothetical protein